MTDAASALFARGDGNDTGGARLSGRNLEVEVASGDTLDVRRFHVREKISGLFEATVVAVSPNPDIDFEAVVGQRMSFSAHGRQSRTWTGVCSHLRQIGVEERGLSTYEVTLVPALWLASQRRNYRVFQQMSEVDIALKVLGEWGVSPTVKLGGAHKKRKYRVQYGESDYTFLCRMLEEAGVSFYFEDGGSLVLDDGPQGNAARAPLPFRMNPTSADLEHVTAVSVGRQIRPGKLTVRDHDARRPPSYPLMASASGGSGVEARLESFHYEPGAFVVESDKGESTPFADDRGKYRADEGEGAALAKKRLEANRAGAKTIAFETNAHDLAPGTVVSFLDHPKSDLGAGKPLLVVESTFSGEVNGVWTHACAAVSAESPYRPPVETPRPRVMGVESATVVGPPGEEIHVDEFGRVRVHFHWDREGGLDDRASSWIPVSQPWGGAGFGGSNLPRVGQEVIVDFLSGDPDRPVIVGRVYTGVQKTPYRLPEHKTKSVWRTQSTGGAGGYNEIMLEDAAGQELFKVQAERDLEKLVKNDESVEIGQDFRGSVGRNELQKIGRDRALEVGGDQSVKIGGDSDRRVGGDESAMIGGDQSIVIGQDRSVMIGGDLTERVARDADVLVGKDLTRNVAANERETTGQNRTITVGGRRTADVGTIDAISVGKEFVVRVSLPEGQQAKQAKGEGEGEDPTTATITHRKIVLTTGAGATLTLDGAEVRIEADVIKLLAKKNVELDAESENVTVHAKTDVSLVADATAYLWARGGPADIQARGGRLYLSSDEAIESTSKEFLVFADSKVFIEATRTTTIYGGQEMLVSSGTSTTIEGMEKVLVQGGRFVTLRSDDIASFKAQGVLVIEGAMVNINR